MNRKGAKNAKTPQDKRRDAEMQRHLNNLPVGIEDAESTQ